MTHHWLINFFRLFLLTFAVACVGAPALGQGTSPRGAYTHPAMDANTVCGKKGVQPNPATIPFIGCFSLEAGRSASGTYEGREFLVTLARNDPYERCSLDGVQSECAGCIVKPPPGEACSAMISVWGRRGGKVILDVARRTGEKTAVTNQENWDVEQKKKPAVNSPSIEPAPLGVPR